MGSGNGGNSAVTSPSLLANIQKLGTTYKIDHDGKFGAPSATGNSQVIYSNNPRKAANRLFNKLAGTTEIEKLTPEGKGQIAKFKDGSHVVFRPKSSFLPTHSPTVEIVLISPFRPRQKIHFEHISLKPKENQ